jgi:predicted ATPase
MKNSYSIWQKIDLHIHTDWSKKTKESDYQGIFSVKILHDKLVENEVKIFSLTDHNIINVPAYKEYYETFQDEDDPLLLLGIELDIEGKTKVYHSLLIFNCSSFVEVEEINRRLEERYSLKNLPIKERKLNFDEIIQILPADDFFFIPHAGNTKSIIDGYKGEISEAQKMLILLQSPMEKVQEKRRQIYNDSFDELLLEAFRNRDDYAYIEFSDNHNIVKYPCTNKGDTGNHVFYYIKGSKNYETLRLAFIDPKSRIKSQDEYTIVNQPRNYIESIKLESSEVIKEKTIYFSPYLNVIIGGRSSGKSLLLDILSNCIDKIEVDTKYQSIESGLSIKVKAKNDDSYKIKTSIDSSVIQIRQGDIVNYFENKRLEDLAKKTGNIDSYNDKRRSFTSLKVDLENNIDSFTAKYKTLVDLQIGRQYVLHARTIASALSTEFLFKVNIEELEKNCVSLKVINDNKDIIEGLEKYLNVFSNSKYFSFTEDELSNITRLYDVIAIKKIMLDSDLKKRESLDSFLRGVQFKINNANSALNSEGQEKAQALTEIANISKDAKKTFLALKALNREILNIDLQPLSYKDEILIDDECKLCLEVDIIQKISDLIIEGIKKPVSQNLYECAIGLLLNKSSLKNYTGNTSENLKKKITSQLSSIYEQFKDPMDFLEYKDGSNSKNNSPGYNSEKYLQVILRNPTTKLIIIDQPEDNLGNKFISQSLVDIIRDLKFKKQIFFVTHNPALVVYGDAEAIILARNDDNIITYEQIKLEDEAAQKEICSVLDGGEYIFDNRSRKYNIQKLLHKGA